MLCFALLWCSACSVDVLVAARAGVTALHLAARAGAYEAVSCLLANYANYMMADEAGWTAIHVAAFFDQVAVLRLLARKHAELVDLPSKDPYTSLCVCLSSRVQQNYS